MKVWLPKLEMAFKRKVLYPVRYEEPKDSKKNDYIEIEIEELKVCKECVTLIEDCCCERSVEKK